MKVNKKELKGRFAGVIGQEYEKLLRSMPHYIDLQDRIAQLASRGLCALRLSAGKPLRILDLGCGTGLTTIALCERIDDAHIIGVDKEPTMLKQYKRNLIDGRMAKHDQGEVKIKAVRADALQFLKRCPSSSFDAVVTGFFLHNLPTKLRTRIVKEIGRVLRPGGIFVNGDKIAPDDLQLHNQHLMEQLTAFTNTYTSPRDAAYCIGWIEHYAWDNQPDIKYTESEVRTSLAAAGFGEVKISGRCRLEAVVSAIRL